MGKRHRASTRSPDNDTERLQREVRERNRRADDVADRDPAGVLDVALSDAGVAVLAAGGPAALKLAGRMATLARVPPAVRGARGWEPAPWGAQCVTPRASGGGLPAGDHSLLVRIGDVADVDPDTSAGELGDVQVLAPEADHGRPLEDLVLEWLRTTPAGLGTALAAVVDLMSVAVDPFRPVHRASLPALHKSRGEFLPELPASHAGEAAPVFLPGLEPTIGGCPSWLLALWDQAGGASMRRGRGAPWDLRIFVAGLLHLSVSDRDGRPRDLTFTAADVASWLHPDGWHRANRRRDWPRFVEALKRLGTLRVPMEVAATLDPRGPTEFRDVALVACTDIPREWRDGTARVTFTVRAPGGAARGVRLDWPRLVRYGAESAPLYRAYLAVSAALHRTAHRGAPAPKLIGAPVVDGGGKPQRGRGGAHRALGSGGPGSASGRRHGAGVDGRGRGPVHRPRPAQPGEPRESAARAGSAA